MSYFLSHTPLKLKTQCEVAGDEARHVLLSRRIKVGETIELQDPRGKRFQCMVTAISKRMVSVLVSKEIKVPAELATSIALYQAFINEQALDLIIQKGTELGLASMHIVQTERSPGKIKPEKLTRWEKISIEAAKQCGRSSGIVIRISDFDKEIRASARNGYYLSEQAPKALSELLPPRKQALSIWVGPEGGWSEHEQQEFERHTITPAKLAGFTLRAETAAIAAITIAANQ
jgi:16S rRNA (uracil1498-N3)-methyltransferase